MASSHLGASASVFSSTRPRRLRPAGHPSALQSTVTASAIRRRICDLRRPVGRLAAALLAVCVGGAPPAFGQDAMQGYYGIRPGVSTKAQVDLSIGEPIRKLSADEAVFEYAPMKEDVYSRRLVIKYEAETSEVARLDAYLRAPLSLAQIRDRFGTRVIARDRNDGAREEVYYPQLQALIFSSRAADAPVAAISHLSPRTMGWIYVGRFDELVAQKQFDEARTEADKAVVVDPDGGEGYLAQGRYYLLQKNYNEALVRFTAASNAKYSSTDKYRAQIEIGRVHESMNAFDKADASYRRAVDVAPPPERADANFRYGAFLNRQKRADEALAILTKAIELDPRHGGARRVAADIHFARKEYDRALPHYEGLSQESDRNGATEKNAVLHFRYAYCLARGGKQSQAISEYEKTVQVSETRVAALNNLGLLYVEAGSFAKAIDSYRAALVAEPKDLVLNRNLAEALLRAGQSDEARRTAELAASLKADDAQSAFIAARSWSALKKKKETMRWLERAISLGFNDRKALTTDPFLARVQDDGDFKKLLLRVQ